MSIGFGIVGCGMISRFHAEAISHIDGAKLIGCFNDQYEGAQKFAEGRDCIAYETLEEMLANEGGELLAETIPQWISADLTPEPQDDALATYTKKITRKDHINLSNI